MVILIAFATSHGSTQGIAERIGSRLREYGLAADVRSVDDVARAEDGDVLAGYDAVILGSAIHGGKWLPEATGFVDRNAAMLRQRPTWLFSVSTVGDEESMFPPRVANRFRAMRKETPELAAIRAAINPREHRNFAGAVSRSDWPPSGRAFFRATGGRYGDHRNWAAIDAWADKIAADLAARPLTGVQPG